MGGAVSELRHAIHAHVVIAQHYPTFLEPMLVVVQYFLRTAETGEGADPTRPVDDIPIDVVIADKRMFEEASTEVELLVENVAVTRLLLRAVETHRSLVLAPDLDPLRRWYDPPWRKDNTKPMPQFIDIPPDEVPRFQIAVLRTSIRCLRLLMVCTDARRQLEELNGPAILNAAVVANALDDFVRSDVKAIFAAVYGGDNAVRRIAIANVEVTAEMMREHRDSAIVQRAGVQRLCDLLVAVDALLYSPRTASQDSSSSSSSSSAALPVSRSLSPAESLFRDLDAFSAVALCTSALRRFDNVDTYLSLYVHVCRFISFVAMQEHNAKIVGQEGGVAGAVALLVKARAMQRDRKQRARDAAAYDTQRRASVHADWNSILTHNSSSSSEQALSSDIPTGAIASLAVVDWTPTEVAQTAMWALDLLAALAFNVALMKRAKLKFVLEEIRLDPDGRALGDALIVTRRLRLIRWDSVGLPPETTTKAARRTADNT